MIVLVGVWTRKLPIDIILTTIQIKFDTNYKNQAYKIELNRRKKKHGLN